jgi:hypothetical protein
MKCKDAKCCTAGTEGQYSVMMCVMKSRTVKTVNERKMVTEKTVGKEDRNNKETHHWNWTTFL